ncbi:MAG: hypothetical protein ACI9ZX_002419 [Algoriphagus sp.]
MTISIKSWLDKFLKGISIKGIPFFMASSS